MQHSVRGTKAKQQNKTLRARLLPPHLSLPAPDANMKLTPVSCQNCGASLEVPDHARFVTCQFCRTQLSVQHTGSAVFTELLGNIADKTNEMAGDLKAIRLQNEIEKLDREWALERAAHMIRQKDGSLQKPGGIGIIFGGIFALGFGIFWTVTALAHTGSFGLFGLVFIACVISAIAQHATKRRAYHSAHEIYQERRRALEDQLNRSA